VRLSTSVRILWADAACINQKYIDERSQQVPLMRTIYQGASQVLIWLGPQDEDVPIAMRLIDKMAALTREELALKGTMKREFVSVEMNKEWGLPAFDSLEWDVLRTFCSRPYFTRAWIVQEIRVARRATTFSSEYEMLWFNIQKASMWLIFKNYRRVLPTQYLDTITAPSLIRMTNLKTTPLLDLLQHTRFQNTTDPKDKVFSIFGLATELIESKDPRQADSGFVPTRIFHGH
jgi:hypothetical protein